jgi:bacterioferritin-associated ferredoxin
MSIEAMKMAREVIRMMGAPSPLHFSKDEIIKWQECNAKIDQAIEQAQKQEPIDYEKLASLGWQAIECSICGSSARAFPKQAQKQEPVAWKHYYFEYVGFGRWVKCDKETYDKTQELYRMSVYTSPPQRQPLTDEQIDAIAKEHIAVGTRSFEEFARRIEAAHGIKGEA